MPSAQLDEIRTAFVPAQNSTVHSQAAKSHKVSRGKLDGSSKTWIKKEMPDPAVARIEFLAQEFFRLIIPHQPETRLYHNAATGVHYILSEEVPGYHPLPNGQANDFGNGFFTGLGQVVLVSLFLQETDLKNGNLGLNQSRQVIKIDGDWCFSEGRRRAAGTYGISPETIASLPYPKGFYTFNWLSVVSQGIALKTSPIISPALVTNPQFRAELNQAMLKICLLPDSFIENLVDSYIPAGGQRYVTMLKERLQALKASALQNESFQAYLASPKAELDAADIALQMNSFVANGQSRVVPLDKTGEMRVEVNTNLEHLRTIMLKNENNRILSEIKGLKSYVEAGRKEIIAAGMDYDKQQALQIKFKANQDEVRQLCDTLGVELQGMLDELHTQAERNGDKEQSDFVLNMWLNILDAEGDLEQLQEIREVLRQDRRALKLISENNRILSEIKGLKSYVEAGRKEIIAAGMDYDKQQALQIKFKANQDEVRQLCASLEAKLEDILTAVSTQPGNNEEQALSTFVSNMRINIKEAEGDLEKLRDLHDFLSQDLRAVSVMDKNYQILSEIKGLKSYVDETLIEIARVGLDYDKQQALQKIIIAKQQEISFSCASIKSELEDILEKFSRQPKNNEDQTIIDFVTNMRENIEAASGDLEKLQEIHEFLGQDLKAVNVMHANYQILSEIKGQQSFVNKGRQDIIAAGMNYEKQLALEIEFNKQKQIVLECASLVSRLNGTLVNLHLKRVSDNDVVLNSYILNMEHNIREAADDLEALEQIDKVLTQVEEAVGSPEVDAVKATINTLREKGSHKKADDVENALCKIPPIERANIISQQGKPNLVQEALAQHQNPLKRSMNVHNKQGEIDINKAADTYKTLKSRFEDVRQEHREVIIHGVNNDF